MILGLANFSNSSRYPGNHMMKTIFFNNFTKDSQSIIFSTSPPRIKPRIPIRTFLIISMQESLSQKRWKTPSEEGMEDFQRSFTVEIISGWIIYLVTIRRITLTRL